MTPDYIEPALAIPVALILLGVYIVVCVFQRQKEQAQHTERLLQTHHALVFMAAVKLWGSNPAGWPAEIRDVLGVES